MKRVCALSSIVLLLPLWGCGSLDVTPEGTLASPVVVATVTSDDEVVLSCDALGNLTVNGRAVDLPVVREDTRLGVRLVDASWLPPVWRPPHAREGGYLVSRLHKASPLALRGLRPLDRVVRLNGEPLGEVPQLAQRLRDSRRKPVAIEARRPDGREIKLQTLADERVGASAKIHVPFLFERRKSSLGSSFGAGPLDVICHWRSRRSHAYVADPSQGLSQYSEDFEWGALCNLLRYERCRDPITGEEKIQFRLFWILSFGDEL